MGRRAGCPAPGWSHDPVCACSLNQLWPRRRRGGAGAAGRLRSPRTHLAGTRTARTAGEPRAHAGTHARAHARGRGSGESELPSLPRAGATRTGRHEHAVMVVAMVITLAVPENQGAGDKDRPDDEDDAGNDHHPRRGLVEPRRLFPRRGWWWRGGYGSRRGRWGWGWGWGLRCFAHHSNIAQRRDNRKGLRRYDTGLITNS